MQMTQQRYSSQTNSMFGLIFIQRKQAKESENLNGFVHFLAIFGCRGPLSQKVKGLIEKSINITISSTLRPFTLHIKYLSVRDQRIRHTKMLNDF